MSDEVPTRGFRDHFGAVSGAYAAYRPWYPRELFTALKAVSPAVSPMVPSRVWDVGAGSGQASVMLAEHFDEVIATDASVAQIAEATAHARVTYSVSPAEWSGLADASVALVTVAQALHWFDVEAFHAEARRVLVSGGVIAEWMYGLLTVPGASRVSALVRGLDREMHDYWPTGRVHIDRAYADLAFPFERMDVGEFAMEREWTVDQVMGYLGSWSAVAACRRRTEVDPLVAFEPELRLAWGEAPTRMVRWPMVVRVGRVS